MGGTLMLLVRLAISMAVVMGVMGVAARLLRRRQGFGGGSTRAGGGSARTGRKGRPSVPVEVLFRRSVAKGANVALVQAGGRQYLLGVTEQSVNLLTEITPGQSGPVPAQPGPSQAADSFRGPGPSDSSPSLLGQLDDIDNWQNSGRRPLSLASVTTPGQPATAWKLAIESLRERTVRR